MTRPFETKLSNVGDWMAIIQHHWPRLLGEFNNDAEFWNDVFHSMEAQDWWDVIDVAKALQIQHPETVDRFRYFGIHIDTIEKRLHRCQPVIKQWNRTGYNGAATSLLMSTRDAINEILGTPTKQWTDKEKEQIKNEQEVVQFFELFAIEGH
jgi:hypothetical protein